MSSNGESLPLGWVSAKLDELVTAPIVYGILQPGPDAPEGVPYVRPTEIDTDLIQVANLRRTSEGIAQKYRRSSLEPADIILSIVGTIGKVALVPASLKGGNITQSSARVRVAQGLLLPEFAAYALRSPFLRRQYDSARLGTAVPRLNLAHVRDLRLPIAPLPEQRRVVDALETYFTRLDDAVAGLDRAERNLRRYRASVLQAAVEGRLVPTEAELARVEGREYEPASVLLEGVLNARRRNWETGELTRLKAAGKTPKDDKWKAKYEPPAKPEGQRPALPEGWCWATLDQLLESPLINGRSVRTAAKGFPVLRLTAFSDRRIDLAERKVGEWTADEAQNYRVAQWDFFVMRGNGSRRLVGRGALLIDVPDPVAFPDTMIRVRVNEAAMERTLLPWLWNSDIVRGQIEACARTTAGIYKVNQRDLENTYIPLAPREEQVRLLDMLERVLSVAATVEREVVAIGRRMARLRETILKAAFEGQLAVQDPNDEPATALLDRIRSERQPDASFPEQRRGRAHPRKAVA